MHVPVMLDEVMAGLAVHPGGNYIDATAGGGGHAEAIARGAQPGGRLVCLDRDAEAVERVRTRLQPFGDCCTVEHTHFAGLAEAARRSGLGRVDGILFDLGLSSFQVDAPERGFSFQNDGPLDMRMDDSTGLTAADLVNRDGETELANTFYVYGEERQSRRVARAIVARRAERRFETTADLAGVVERVLGGRRGRLHPATRVFMALRIAVNGELESLEPALESALAAVAIGGRVAAISFHSIEDRIVKRVFSEHVGKWISLQQGGRSWSGRRPTAQHWRGSRPLRPAPEEVSANPRARSARLRVVERTD
jgi:16S rRNA (cytosine1402-N4)-methyltransferase